MKPKYDKKSAARAARIIGKKRSYGSLKRVAKPRGFKNGRNYCQDEMLDLHMAGNDVLNILVCNAYRLGFKAGRASRTGITKE